MKLAPVTNRIAGAIEVFDNAIGNPSEILDTIIKIASWDRSLVGAGESRVSDARTSDTTWINPFDFRISPVLYDFCKTAWHYLDDYGMRYGQSFSGLEQVSVNRYSPGQKYDLHADAGGQSPRVISGLVYLNDDFTGGETEFPLFNEAVQPKAGRMVLFPSNYAYVHGARPPKGGTKYSAAFWVHR